MCRSNRDGMTSVGVPADTGFLIGLERHKQRAIAPRQARILELVRTEPMTERLAKLAGEALSPSRR